MADLKKLVDELSKLTVLEAAELTEMLEEKWGVSAAAPMAMAAAVGAAGGAAGEPAEEKTEFDVILKEFFLAVDDRSRSDLRRISSLRDAYQNLIESP